MVGFVQILPAMNSTHTFFIARIALAWLVFSAIFANLLDSLSWRYLHWLAAPLVFAAVLTAVIHAAAHARRVRLISPEERADQLANHHRRQIEMPVDTEQAFALAEAAIRDLPHIVNVQGNHSALRVDADQEAPPSSPLVSRLSLPFRWPGDGHNRVSATVTKAEGGARITLICEPRALTVLDWFLGDHGANLENMETLNRTLSRRTAEQRRAEQAGAQQTALEKELSDAKLSLLQAQVEPHFLYNTLASAQLLARNDPPRADLMLGHLIDYLRYSLPSTDEPISNLGKEVERANAYLQILQIRMGERLKLEIEVPAELNETPVPRMMLQTLVENAIKHGLEPKSGGGTVWLRAREAEGKVSITVADDGLGFNAESSGTGIGLRNLRERLRLGYGDAASFSIGSNFPTGVAATIVLPLAPRVANTGSQP